MRLEGKRALVTGSSQGIGAEVAKLFAKEGAAVAISHRARGAHHESVVGSIRRAGGEAIAIHADVSDPASVDAMYGEIRRRLGGLDILVNMAGFSDRSLWNLSLDKTTLAMWERVFAVDTYGTFLCTQGAARLM